MENTTRTGFDINFSNQPPVYKTVVEHTPTKTESICGCIAAVGVTSSILLFFYKMMSLTMTSTDPKKGEIK